jgi:hypothetical protein
MPKNDEVKEEIDSLTFIYPEEMTILGSDSIEIFVRNDDPELAHLSQDDDRLFVIKITFGEQYPNEIPEFEVASAFLSEQELSIVCASLQDQSKDFLGMAMVFSMVSFLKEQVESVLGERLQREEAERERIKAEKQEIENLKFMGTKVTKESFLEWRRKFVEEAHLAEKSGEPMILAFQTCLAVERMDDVGSKLTGKQLFEQNKSLLKSDEKYLDEGEDVVVDKELFKEFCDLSLEETNVIPVDLGD